MTDGRRNIMKLSHSVASPRIWTITITVAEMLRFFNILNMTLSLTMTFTFGAPIYDFRAAGVFLQLPQKP